jgi:hypothetical protein
MYWKLVLLVATATGLAQAEGTCPTVPVPGESAVTNFVFNAFSGGWDWTSGSVPGITIGDSGLVTWKDNSAGGKANYQVTQLCIEYNPGSGVGYTCVSNADGNCYLSTSQSIENVWGFA